MYERGDDRKDEELQWRVTGVEWSTRTKGRAALEVTCTDLGRNLPAEDYWCTTVVV